MAARVGTGGITTKETQLGTSYNARFRALGKRRSVLLGYSAHGMTPRRAEQELQNILADVRRGIWQPPEPIAAAPEPRPMPTFHEVASEWFQAQKVEGGRSGKGLSPSGEADLEWRLSSHLLPAFAAKRLDEITVEDVDRYRRGQVAEGRLGTTSINKTLATLSAVLEVAVEYDLISRNVAKGRRRRLPAAAPRRTWIDRADHLVALLDGAGELDRRARAQRGQRRALLATLVYAGPRIGEALSLRWRDVDLARGTITIRASKTDAGIRRVQILPILRDELLAYRAGLRDAPGDMLVFGTSTGQKHSRTNVRRRMLAGAVELANVALERDGIEPLPDGLTPHSLRRTFASLLFAIGEPPPHVMAQMGHTTPALTLAIYAKVMDRRDGEPERLKALVQGLEWEPVGTSGPVDAIEPMHHAAV